MTKRYLGNIITNNPTAPAGSYENDAASGVWSLAEAFAYTKAGLWPIAGNAAPRGLFAGGLASGGVTSNVIDYLIISTTGNATDFGDLTAATRDIVSYGSNGTRAVFGLGFTTDVNNPVNTLEYVTIFSTGNATDFGDATVGRRLTDAGFSSSTRGVNGGGKSSSSTNLNVIDYITIATTGNATDFGNLSAGRQELSGLASPTRGIFAGDDSNPKNTIDYITISSTGNATDFGDLTQGQNNFAGLSSNTRGVFGGGEAAGNVMQYITIASTGNSTDFGDLTRSTYHLAGTSTSTRGVFGGGASFSNIVDYIEIASTGNATDFGDLTVGRQELGATSSAHGGIAA
jgi:hypothetical protein